MALAALAAAAFPGPALADVKAGVEAWSRGDYSSAVREWQGPAAVGDPDAMFNLAQAYRLGRGVALDAHRAEALYAKAAAAGHVQAADTYGLMLFQDGQRQAALPYIEDAARRGDPRSQYLLGIAHFNGDLVGRDWVRAYALVTLANSAGLPQAASAVAQMDQQIPLAQRQQSAGLAQQMRAEAEAARNVQLAAADLERDAPAGGASAPLPGATAPREAAPRERATRAVSPSVAAALAAIAEASRATGTESPGEAGARFARHAAGPPRATRPVVAQAAPAPAPTPQRPLRIALAPAAAGPAAAAPEGPPRAPAVRAAPVHPAAVHAPSAPTAKPPPGAWRVQLGAFAVAGNATRAWDRVSARAELAGKQRLLVEAGGMTRLQAGGFASRAAADAACRALQRDGIACLATDR